MKLTKKFLTALMIPIALQGISCNAQTENPKEPMEKKDNLESPMKKNDKAQTPVDPNKSYDFFVKKELYDLYEDILEEYNEQKLFPNMKEWEEDKADILKDFNEVKPYCNDAKCKTILEKLHRLLTACDDDVKGKVTKDNIENLKNEILKEIKSL